MSFCFVSSGEIYHDEAKKLQFPRKMSFYCLLGGEKWILPPEAKKLQIPRKISL